MAIQDHDSLHRECGESKTNGLPKALSLYTQGSSSCLPWLMDGSVAQAPLRTLLSFPLIFHTVLSFPLLLGWPSAEADLAKKLMKALTVPQGVNRLAGPPRPATLTIHACLWVWGFFTSSVKGLGNWAAGKRTDALGAELPEKHVIRVSCCIALPAAPRWQCVFLSVGGRINKFSLPVNLQLVILCASVNTPRELICKASKLPGQKDRGL